MLNYVKLPGGGQLVTWRDGKLYLKIIEFIKYQYSTSACQLVNCHFTPKVQSYLKIGHSDNLNSPFSHWRQSCGIYPQIFLDMPTHESVSMSRRWPCSSIRLMFSHGNFDSWQRTPGRPEWSLQVLVGRVSISAAAMWAAYKLQLYSIHQYKSVYILLVFMGISVIQKVPNRANR